MSRISSNSATYEEFKHAVFTSVAVAVAAGVCGRIELGTALRPLNGISHILWGPHAGKVNTINAKYTLAGLALNTGACWFWAWLYRKGAHKVCASTSEAATGAVGVAALAYVTDYHLIPRRFTPGFELSLSRHSFPWLYAALAAGLFIPYLNNVKGHKAEAFADHCEYPGRTKKAEDRSNVERKRTD
jgi:hypothetical protein